MTAKKTYIQSFCTIQNNQILMNGEVVFSTEPTAFSDFSKKTYQHLEMNYPKFFKMDNLSKLAFLGAEFLLKSESNFSKENNTALVFANKSSSLDTDVKYQNSISDAENYYPSPAVFVYTLPNICLGEISIKHQLKSENSFFIFADYNPEFMEKYSNILLETLKADKVLCGWVEYYNENYKAFLYLVDKEGEIEHNQEILKKLYKQ
ncbi:3-oxoacyl-ACP synthase [Flavobacterium aquariorum]|uniref:3-oxoacyl-ACP synthase n=1 Tax=Flavobacterium aquariorum TaxID=2217670 RepID=A0A2W7UF60_9FLAO|nr:3-oxoacyl-ACP synthase [Flavobacterium aquariorum]PZX91985.1 3-oxoacyl-ACP synthase [Flavobacterium aquariorum]